MKRMALVTVKNKYQVVIPRRVRELVGIAIGDVLEAKAEKGKVVFEPKSIVDRGIAESIAEFKAGRAKGPFSTHQEFIASLHQESTRLHPKKAKRTRR
jgi:AbrB family looped-hinge helix DNA binding protein